MRGARRLALLLLLGALACQGAAPRVLKVSVPWEADTLDPHVRNTLSDFALVSSLYEALVTTDADMRIRPALAASWENPDRSTWVFHLRPGARFHSGKALEAKDVVWSLERLATEPGLEMATYARYIAGAEALDARTVRVRTTRPLSILLNKLRFVAIVPHGADAAHLRTRVDGTGPYVVQEWEAGRRLELRRFDGYWGPDPAFARVSILLGRDPEGATRDFLEGGADIVQASTRQAGRTLEGESRARVVRRPSLFVKYLGFDFREKRPDGSRNPFHSLLVRQAVQLGVDRGALVGQLRTEAVPAGQQVPPFIFGFNPRLPIPTRDVPRARELLARAGWAEGFATDLHVRNLYADAAFVLRDQLREVGIRLTVVPLPDVEFLDRARRGEFGFYLSRFGCPTGDASDLLDTALHSRDVERRMGLQNYGHYASPAVDEAIESSAEVESVTDRRAALEQVLQLVQEDVVWVALYADQDVYAVDRRLAWEPRNDSFVLPAEVEPLRRR
jgi:peptide/nickel transport system substrate-binding protein